MTDRQFWNLMITLTIISSELGIIIGLLMARA